MFDLQTKSAIISNILQVQHQATSQAFSTILFDDPYISEFDGLAAFAGAVLTGTFSKALLAFLSSHR
jgi:hypothetical protein